MQQRSFRTTSLAVAGVLFVGAYLALVRATGSDPVAGAEAHLEELGWDLEPFYLKDVSHGMGFAGQWAEVGFASREPAQAGEVRVSIRRIVPFAGWSLRAIESDVRPPLPR